MHKNRVKPCARPNGTSDILFERTNLMYDFYVYSSMITPRHTSECTRSYHLITILPYHIVSDMDYAQDISSSY